jgi:hypothetical protein
MTGPVYDSMAAGKEYPLVEIEVLLLVEIHMQEC